MPSIEGRRAALTYGADDRRAVYDVPLDDPLAALARTSLLALGRTSELLMEPGAQSVRVTSPSAEERLGLCAGERFGTEPAFAICTAFPVGPHFALTANHCLDVVPLAELVALSGFYELAPGIVAPLEVTQVRPVAAVVAQNPGRDVALLRLGGEPLAPLALAATPPLPDDPLSCANHEMGVPAKLVTGAHVFSFQSDAFVTDLDVAGGASGAPVFDDANLVVGVLTSGSSDYELTDTGCFRSRMLPDGSLFANELVEDAQLVLDDLCPTRTPSGSCEEASGAAGCAVGRSSGTSQGARSSESIALLLGLFLWVRGQKRRARTELRSVGFG